MSILSKLETKILRNIIQLIEINMKYAIHINLNIAFFQKEKNIE